MGTMTPADPEPAALDSGWIADLIRRWKLADEYVADLANSEALPAEHALKRIIRVDFPLLLKELIRLRPELAY